MKAMGNLNSLADYHKVVRKLRTLTDSAVNTDSFVCNKPKLSRMACREESVHR